MVLCQTAILPSAELCKSGVYFLCIFVGIELGEVALGVYFGKGEVGAEDIEGVPNHVIGVGFVCYAGGGVYLVGIACHRKNGVNIVVGVHGRFVLYIVKLLQRFNEIQVCTYIFIGKIKGVFAAVYINVCAIVLTSIGFYYGDIAAVTG